MPRTLPWLKSEAKNITTSSFARPSKRQKTTNQDGDDHVPRPAKSKATFGAVSRAARTPSTSPPPEPPTEELMFEGLDRDDIYIMVEDEFLAVAQTFTQHLHHAEYMRLKTLARARNASTAANISRPVDSITAMRAETKKKKEAETRQAKNKIALEQIKGTARRRPRSEDSDPSGLEDKDGGHWGGTALRGFMTTSPSKNQTSLTGLQRIKSSTRAAAGFSKAELKPSHTSAKPFDLAPKPSNQHKSTTPLPNASISESTDDDDDDDDDLDAPIPKQPTAASKTSPPRTTRKAPNPRATSTPRSHPPPSTQNQNQNQAQTPLPSNKKNPPPPSSLPRPPPKEDIIPRSTLIETEAARRRLQARTTREAEKDKERRGKGVQVDEIPVFLY